MYMRSYKTIEISDKDNLAINFLYNSRLGRVFLNILVRTSVSKFLGFLMDRSISKLFIRGFIKRNNINMEEYEDVKYKSFNDFFTRRVKNGLRTFPNNEFAVTAPCDGKLTVYPITEDSIFHIKNSIYDVSGLLQNKKLAGEFMNGVCLIFRLTPDDYHRYSFIDSGKIIGRKRIKGVLHTVRPIAQERHNIYVQNSRECTIMDTKNFGKVAHIEVGALFVGRIKNHIAKGMFQRGDEKGMFEFGGSTIVMLFQKDVIEIDEMLYKNTQENKETIVRMGDILGEKTPCGKKGWQ